MDGDGCFWIVAAVAVIGGVYYFNAEDEPVVQVAEDITPSRPMADIFVTETENGTKWKLDVSSVAGVRDKRRGWLIQDHSNDKTTQYRETRELWLVNCETSEYKNPKAVAYTTELEPKILYEEKVEDLQSHYAVPDTNGASVVNEICSSNFDEPKPK